MSTQAEHVAERKAVAALVRKLNVKRTPVGITFCAEAPPAGYAPADVPACAIVREAEAGRMVYVDGARHDCIVGQYHLGLMAGTPLVTEGHYLTMAQGFFTPEGARCNKQNSHSLPAGSIAALAAAPLDAVPDDLPVHLMVVVCPPQQAMVIAGASSVRTGEFAHGELGASACSSIFAAPRNLRNTVFALGDGGGRAFNKLDASELFVALPADRFAHSHRPDGQLLDQAAGDASADPPLARPGRRARGGGAVSEQFRAILFSGGAGSRLWPLSRRGRPKQFQPLVGPDSLFQLMVRRLESSLGIEHIYVSTGRVYREIVLEQIPALPPENVIAEPEMRDTLAAVGFAVAVLDHRYPGSTIATLWGADHIVRRDDEFVACLQAAHQLAREHDWVVKIDVRPSYPSPALGYIEYGERRGEADGRAVYSFVRQVEKPPAEEAERLILAGTYLWNTGYIVWTAEKILSLYREHAPEAYQALQQIVAVLDLPDAEQRIPALYARIPKMSIDKGIFEKMAGEDMVVMPAELGWGDIGAWDVLRDELAAGDAGNAAQGLHLQTDTTNTLVYAPPGKTVVTLGVDNLIIVDTGDALLVMPAGRAQEVKAIVQRLERERPDLL